ncbi:KICSTOR complex protein kaptin-like [Anthonomus grandis grandis]|uniref:KICSTOR complex protein kaptin-like n=1 Tax=Anthonomus grandis grandis TaxID=2921223 RepID=UPI002165C920|nr:KICSTOR complex protein kaptin-like [Anthonomus grandis grandis]
MEQFKDAHYFHIPSQGNIYTMCDLQLGNEKNLILAASLKRDIFYFEYLETSRGMVPTTKEISFTYIPSGAEIISIDAFNKSSTSSEAVIGITIIKNSNESDTLETFLNIYSQLEEHEDFNIENIAQNCFTVELNFIPYKLMHTELIKWDGDTIVKKEIVFVLSGSDNQVHIYRENPTEHMYKEIDSKEYFPEFSKTTSPVVWIDMLYMNNYEERITTFGCEDGYVKLLKVNTKTNKLVYNFSTRFTNYVASVHLYFENTPNISDKFAKSFGKTTLDKRVARPILNLIVVNSILPPVICRDVLKYGLSDYDGLARHDNGTIFTCCAVADIDFDGQKEILVGTSSEEIILYKMDNVENKWFMEEIKYMAAPILSLKYLDVSGDGVRELIVSSMKGIHVLQHDPVFVQKKLNEKIDALTIPKIQIS